MTLDQERRLLQRVEELLVQVKSLSAQLHTHIGQQRVRELLQQAQASKPNMTADELAQEEFEISKRVHALLDAEARRIEAQMRDIVRIAAQSDPQPPDAGSISLN